MRWLLAVWAVGLILTVAAAAPASTPSTDATQGISAPELNRMFNTYGDTSGKWNGADRTASIRLPDGRLLWLFSDTFLGPVNPDGSRPLTSPFINNSAIVQEGRELRETRHGGSALAPTALVPAAGTDEFHWIGDATVLGDQLQVLVNRYRRTGTGPFDHALLGTALATFDLPGLNPTGLRPLPLADRISWGSEVLTDGAHTYVYGTEAVAQMKFAHVARVAGTDLGGQWQFWSGSGWTAAEDSSARLLSGVGTSYGMQRVGDRYVLVSHENNVALSADIVAYTAETPTGPFSGPEYLLRTPENDDGHIVYDAQLHPELARPGRLLLSYNVNNVDDAASYADARVYRPRFVEVDWPRPAADRPGLPAAPTELTVAVAGAGTAALRWRPGGDSKGEYQAHRRDVTAGQSHFVRVGPRTSEPRHTADFLVNGHVYEFRVTAVNRRGEGRPSDPVTMTAVVPPPPPPVNVRAVADATGDIVLRWDPIPFVQVYRVSQRNLTVGERKPVVSGTHLGTTARVGLLRHGQEYEFTVVAVGGGGDSRPSAPVRVRPVVQPPEPPVGLTAVARSDGAVRLSWRVTGLGLHYRVYRRDLTAGEGAPGQPSFAGTTGIFDARGLTHDHEYEFTVAAVNGGGEGRLSTPVRTRARMAAPRSAPTGLRAKAGAGQVKLTWRSPYPTGWHRVHRRDLTAKQVAFVPDELPTQGTSATIPLLLNGHEYEFRVTALNAAGDGPPSPTVRAKPTLPAPAGLAVAASGPGSVELTWRSAGPGVYYRIYRRDVTAAEPWQQDPYPVNDTRWTGHLLVPGHRYEFQVAAADATSIGPRSPVVRLTAR